MHTCILFLIIIFYQPTICAQSTNSLLPLKDRLDLVFDRYNDEYVEKGHQACVMISDSIVWKGNYGISHDTFLIGENSLFPIGSLTKTLTSTVILQLIEEGKLTLADTIGEFLPAHENINPSITIEQLLNHSSGLYDGSDDPDYWDTLWSNPEKIWILDDWLHFTHEPYFQPGEGFHYSNTGYFFLGEIIEQITGNSYKHELTTRIIEPIALKNTFYFPFDSLYDQLVHPWGPEWADQPGPLQDNAGKSITNSNISAGGAAGATVANATDVAKLINSIFYKKDLIADSSIEKMIKINEEYIFLSDWLSGYGTFRQPFQRFSDNVMACVNGGLVQLFWSSAYSHILEDSITIASCWNTLKSNNDVHHEIYTAFINTPPIDLTLSNVMFSEALTPNSFVGSFEVLDTNYHDLSSYSFELIDGEMGEDNSCFKTSGNNLLANCEINSESDSIYHVRVKCHDGFGGYIEKAFSLKNNLVGIEKQKNSKSIKVFPNPAEDFIQLKSGSHNLNEIYYAIFDITGQQISEGSIVSGIIPLNRIQSGLYVLELHFNDGKVSRKILIQ